MQTDGWRIWKCEVDNHAAIESFFRWGLEPFAVSDGSIYWRKFVREDQPDLSSDG